MPLLSLSAAARATGRSRTTIHNYLKSGRLSHVIDAGGNKKIDTSELLRVFGELVSEGSTDFKQSAKLFKMNSDEHPEKPPKDTQQDEIAAILKEQLQAALEREKVLMETLQREQEARREIEQRLLALPEGPAKKPGLFARLFGSG